MTGSVGYLAVSDAETVPDSANHPRNTIFMPLGEAKKFHSGPKDTTDDLIGCLQNHLDKKWFSWTLPVDELDPLAYLEQRGEEPDQFYWEQPDSGLAIAAGGSLLTLKATGPGRFDEISNQSRRLRREHASWSGPSTDWTGSSTPRKDAGEPVLVGGYSFSDHSVHKMWKPMGAARFFLPRWTLIRKQKDHMLTLTVSLEGKSMETILHELRQAYREFREHAGQIRSHTHRAPSDTSRPGYRVHHAPDQYDEWRRKVNRARKLIRQGVFQKIVIARHLDFESVRPIRTLPVLHHLRQRFAECFNFLIRVDGGPRFIGATPERLIALEDRKIRTEGLAGSISRGESAVEDLTLAHTLLECSKDRSEHDYVVRHIRSRLEPYAFRVVHPHSPVVKKLSNVQHLYTPISAEIRNDFTIHNLAGSLHPTPAVGGYPKNSAVPYINEIEGTDRGWYAGPVGWYDLSGNGEFAVAIRSAWVNGTRARLFAGCGIVEDSDPQTEWNETKMKLNPMLDALKRANDPSLHE